MCRFLIVVLCLLVFSFPTFSFGGEIKSDPDINAPEISGLYQFSFENISLPASEELGLLGANYLIENSLAGKSSWNLGLGVYGAVTGERGGFFTGGFHLGWRYSLSRSYFLESNAFVGGGGGGSAPQGGGLMLRAAAGLGKQVGLDRYLLGLSRVSFPNGAINSNQISFAYSRQFSLLHFSGWSSDSVRSRWRNAFANNKSYSQQISVQVMNYFPGRSVKGRDSRLHESMLSVLGIRVSQQMGKVFWGEFETAGGMSGGIDGFAQVLGGLSVKKALHRKVSLTSGWLLGAAGGGNVDTGGGMITRAYSGVEVVLSPRWRSYLQLGYVSAFDGGFSAKTVNMNLVYQFQNISTEKKSIKKSASTLNVKWRKLRVRPGVQRYTRYAKNARKYLGTPNPDVDLTNLKLDAFVSRSVFFTGQALGAFDGGAGGYAVGLLGPGIQINRYVGVELLAGVAGGGGIAVGSGKIIQPMINFELPHNKRWSSEISVGYIKAVDEALSAYVLNAGLVYRFAQPYY